MGIIDYDSLMSTQADPSFISPNLTNEKLNELMVKMK